MRIHKLGSRFLRVVTPDGKVHYFSASGFTSLRVFWIFRNFSNLDDRVLSARQLQLIQRVCSGAELPRGPVDFAGLIGTLELSTSGYQAWNKQQLPQVAAQRDISAPEIRSSQPFRVPTFVLSATALAACLLVAVTVLANRTVRRQIATLASKSFKSMSSMLPRVPHDSGPQPQAADQRSPEPQLINVPLSAHAQGVMAQTQLIPDMEDESASLGASANRTELTRASLQLTSLIGIEPGSISIRAENSTGPVHNLTAKQQLVAGAPTGAELKGLNATVLPPHALGRKRAPENLVATLTEALPPSGPPQTRPVLGDFPAVSQETKVILRAIVSSDGKVARVHVVEGNPALAREAARTVTSWRYSPRTGSGDAESRILFQFAPDVTTVSFLNAAAAKISR
jgi:TonB family protein